jgi:hypothetical protein
MTTTNSHPNNSRRPPGGGRPGPAVPAVADELRRLMPRDRWLIDLLYHHQVFTTEQVAALGFDNVHTARNRLNLLTRRGVLARFRDAVRPGSQSWRWTLGWIGAAWIAYRDGQPVPRPGTVADRVNRLSSSPRLPHLLGVNGFFVDLVEHARTKPGARLDRWWSERQCREVAGELAHPDGHGMWTDHGRTVSWWLEYDTGSEPARRVLEKLEGYVALHRATGLRYAVLIRMQTARQETQLHNRLRTHPAVTRDRLLVATMSGDHTVNPTAAVWLIPGHGVRLPLALLPIGADRDDRAA